MAKIRVTNHPRIIFLEIAFMLICVYFGYFVFLFKGNIHQYLQSFSGQLIILTSCCLYIVFVFYYFIKHFGYIKLEGIDLDEVTINHSNLKTSSKVVDKSIWWNYSYGAQVFKTGTAYKKNLSNKLCVWVLLSLESGDNIYICKRLYPWQDIPEGLNYKVEMESSANDDVESGLFFLTQNSLRKFYNKVYVP